MSKGFNYWREHWQQKAEASKKLTDSGGVLITWQGRRLQVCAPLNPAFVDGARELLGRWRPTSRMWTFNVRSARLVMELCIKVYGKDAITTVGFPAE